ncbi:MULTISPECIES: DUF417 family protein [Aeromonas]|uniref:DUF417 family protein n=1 Tax=Aeromonas TaxID=642 RepID=UPI0022DF538B|nr:MULTISPECIES: DUF417 family protein [Aeromonas]WEA31109.1 DUF417 family protein [Aeromonas hydrophila]
MLIFNRLLAVLAGGDRLGATLCRIAVGVVFIWIGLLKFIPYEADSITPFVANSPFMSFFYELRTSIVSTLITRGSWCRKTGPGTSRTTPMATPMAWAWWNWCSPC